jgi:hypothetical protein
MRTLVLALAALVLVAPVAAAGFDEPCTCDPSPCGPAPSVRTDPGGYADWLVCNALGGHPW